MRLTIVRGLPGTGKSVFAGKLGCLHFSDDHFRMKNGEFIFNWKDGIKPSRCCQFMVALALRTGVDVVVSNPFVLIEEIQPYLQLGRQNDADIQVVRIRGMCSSCEHENVQVVRMMLQQWEDFPGEMIIDV